MLRKAAAYTLGIGAVAIAVAILSGPWGPCGPSNIVGGLALLIALPLLPIGLALSVFCVLGVIIRRTGL